MTTRSGTLSHSRGSRCIFGNHEKHMRAGKPSALSRGALEANEANVGRQLSQKDTSRDPASACNRRLNSYRYPLLRPTFVANSSNARLHQRGRRYAGHWALPDMTISHNAHLVLARLASSRQSNTGFSRRPRRAADGARNRATVSVGGNYRRLIP